VALASLSGRSDAAWARAGLPNAGAAFLGGIAVDDATREAARAMVDREREEFLPPDPVGFVAGQLDALADAPLRPAVNVRSATLPPIRAVARVCAARGAVLEVNAHCRQAEMCAAGAGESLLRDPDRLAEQVAAAAGVDDPDAGEPDGPVATTGPTVSVKLRTELSGVDLPAVARRAVAAGADWLHVDAMDSEPEIADVVAAARDVDRDARVIANNGVRDGPTAREYLRYGADAVSVGRASDDPETLARVRRAVEAWLDGPAGDGADTDRDADPDSDRGSLASTTDD
jgi:TIM-barrel protein